MSIISVAAVGVISAIIIVFLKRYNPEYAIVATVISGCVIVSMVLSSLLEAVKETLELLNGSGVPGEVYTAVFKAVGVCFLTQFAADICIDAGQKTLSDKVELCGRIAIVFLMLPFVGEITEAVRGLL